MVTQEEILNKKLITEYLLFKDHCTENCMRNIKEIQGLFKIKLELKDLLSQIKDYGKNDKRRVV